MLARADVHRSLLLADTDPGAFARTGGVPDLDAELACASDEEAARLQTRANDTDSRATHPPPPEEASRAFFTAPRDVARLFRATLCSVGRARTRFELGVRRDGPPLAVYASGDVLLSA